MYVNLPTFIYVCAQNKYVFYFQINKIYCSQLFVKNQITSEFAGFIGLIIHKNFKKI